MQMPDTARQATANTGAHSHVSADSSASQSGKRVPDQAAEAALRWKTRRQGLLLMAASSLCALALAAGAWWLIRQLL
jgi:hypothetical protein